MNAKQLRQWKELQKAESLNIGEACKDNSEISLLDFYPEFNLKGKLYTTSLDPRVPLWQVLPFFEKIIVGILPYLSTEEEFKRWYGVTSKQMLWLYENNFIELRIIFPRSKSTIPNYLNPFFEFNLPSGLRDSEFTNRLLGNDGIHLSKERFNKSTTNFKWSLSIDGFAKDPVRAKKTAEYVYLQLNALGYYKEVSEFEALCNISENTALEWLELCRLLLIGPIHYSMGGVHCVPYQVLSGISSKTKNYNTDAIQSFPSELAHILIEFYRLYSPKTDLMTLELKEVIDIKSEVDTANRLLFSLHNQLINRKIEINTLEDFKSIVTNADDRFKNIMRTLRILAASGLSLATMPINPIIGLLAGIGFQVVAESSSKPVDKALVPIAKKVLRDPVLTLIVEANNKLKMKS